MEIVLPSLTVLLLAIIIVVVVFPSLAPFTLMVLAVLALVAAVYSHLNTFSAEYWNMVAGSGAGAFAPTFIVGIVVLLSLGFLLSFLGSRVRLQSYGPPDTSKNWLTNPFGGNRNNAGRAAAAAAGAPVAAAPVAPAPQNQSLLSGSGSVLNRLQALPRAEQQSVLARRLAYAV